MQIITGKSAREGSQFNNIRQVVFHSREKYSTGDAFIFRKKPTEAEIHKTYKDFGDDVEAFGTACIDMGLSDLNLSVIGENAYEWVVSYAAIVSGVGTGVPLDRLLPENEVTNLLRRGRVHAIVYHHKHHDMMLSIAAMNEFPDLLVRYFICMDPTMLASGLPDDPRFLVFSDLVSKGRKLLAEGDTRFADKQIDPDQVNILLFTSGTTAASKGVMLSPRNICTNLNSISTALIVEPGERAFSILPLHHTFENTVDFYLLSRGCVICFSDGLRYLIKNIQEWHVEVVVSVPLLFENVHRKIKDGIEESGKTNLINFILPVTRFLRKLHIDIRRIVFSDILKKLGGHLRLVVIGGAGIDKSIIQDFNDFGIDFFMGYGLTETSPVISSTTQECNVFGSVGRPIKNIEVAIDTEDPRRGAIGEILTRSDCVMHGYYENQEATDEVLMPDGWFRTGDMGYLDKHDCIHITGRVKSMIVLTNGKKVFPEEIESLLNLLPGVRESFVWGDDSQKDSVEICAKILVDRQEIGKHLPIPDKNPGDNSIRDYLRDHIKTINHQMPSFKAIRYFIFSEGEMVKTTTLKIKRAKELEAIRERMNQAGSSLKTANGQNLDTL